MVFSVVIASYLGPYPSAAKDRDKKIFRAIESVKAQSFQDFEIIVIADGCKKTVELMKQYDDVRTFYIEKAKQWSGEPRNKGIEEARGEFIVYLDIDDVFGADHLKGIHEGLGTYDWVWFDDIRYDNRVREWYQNPCDITQIGRHGTSNVCHKKSLPARWNHVGYAHDYYFVVELRQNGNFAKIDAGEYYVCHIPGIYEL